LQYNNQNTTFTYTPQTQTFANPNIPAETVTFTFFNITRTDYPDSTSESFVYDGNCNQLTHTRQGGQTWTYVPMIEIISLDHRSDQIIMTAYSRLWKRGK
jgi:hypothetical protein